MPASSHTVLVTRHEEPSEKRAQHDRTDEPADPENGHGSGDAEPAVRLVRVNQISVRPLHRKPERNNLAFENAHVPERALGRAQRRRRLVAFQRKGHQLLRAARTLVLVHAALLEKEDGRIPLHREARRQCLLHCRVYFGHRDVVLTKLSRGRAKLGRDCPLPASAVAS